MAKLIRVLNYYGSKVAAARHYPTPRHTTIIEPFAGGAGYSLLYRSYNVLLIDMNPDVINAWAYLIRTPSADIRKLPLLAPGDPVPSDIDPGAQLLIGWSVMLCGARPQRLMVPASARVPTSFWCATRRDAMASLSDTIRHWRCAVGSYEVAPDIEATWFIDPPYIGRAGSHYVHNSDSIDYSKLGTWCRSRIGQTIVCEGAGASWLPFTPHHTHVSAPTADIKGRRVSSEWCWID